MRCAECSSKRATRLHRRCVDTLQSDAQPRLFVRFADGPGPIYVLARTGTLTGHFKSIVHHAGMTNAARRLPSREGAPPPPAAPLAAAPLAATPQCGPRQLAPSTAVRQRRLSGPLPRAAHAGTRRPPPRSRWRSRITALSHATDIHHAWASAAQGGRRKGEGEEEEDGEGEEE